jgi:hypothetical protein
MMMISLTRLFRFSASIFLYGFALPADAQRAPRPSRRPTPIVVNQNRILPRDSLPSARLSDSLSRVRAPGIPPRRRFWFENTIANVYDSNIEHDSTNIGSYGVIAGARAMYRSRTTTPMIQLEYAAAVHQYTATDRWDRLSHLGRAGIDMPVNHAVSVGLTLEAFLKGSSEDREIGDQIALLPRLELKPSRNTRVRFIGAYRKRYFETETSNATNVYGAADARVRFGISTVEAAARVEENRPQLARLGFHRQTYTARYIRAVTDRDELLVGVEYRPVKYPERFVEIDVASDDNSGPGNARDRTTTIEVPRHDERWKPHFSWTREWTRNLLTELEYEYEMRSSNDPDKRYRGHILTFTTAVPW